MVGGGGSVTKIENSVGEANEVSFKGFQWKERMGYIRDQREDNKLLERARQ